jgi:hypothetical protein
MTRSHSHARGAVSRGGVPTSPVSTSQIIPPAQSAQKIPMSISHAAARS